MQLEKQLCYLSGINAEEEIVGAIDSIGPLARRLDGHLERSKASIGDNKLDSIDDLAEGLTRLADIVIITMDKFAEGANKWKG